MRPSLFIFLFSSCLVHVGSSQLIAKDAVVVDSLNLLDENELVRWEAASFAFEGDLDIRDGVLNTGWGSYLSGVTWKGDPPARTNYEIELEARYTYGSDFFLGLTFPVGDRYCTWIVGGWGGTVVGISNIDDHSADDNETTLERSFTQEQWYRCKVRVIGEHIQCWIDGERVIDINTEGRKLNLRPGQIEGSIPLGLAAYDTIGEYRNMVWRNLMPSP